MRAGKVSSHLTLGVLKHLLGLRGCTTSEGFMASLDWGWNGKDYTLEIKKPTRRRIERVTTNNFDKGPSDREVRGVGLRWVCLDTNKESNSEEDKEST